MNALASSVNVWGMNSHSSPCRFTYLCVKEPDDAFSAFNASMAASLLAAEVTSSWEWASSDGAIDRLTRTRP